MPIRSALDEAKRYVEKLRQKGGAFVGGARQAFTQTPKYSTQELRRGVKGLPASFKSMTRQAPEAFRRTITAASPIETAVAGAITKAPGVPLKTRVKQAFTQDKDLVTALRSRNVPGAFPLGLAASFVIPGAGEVGALRKAKAAKVAFKGKAIKNLGAGLADIKVSKGVKKTSLKEGFWDLLKNIETDMANRYAPIQRLTKGKKLLPSKDPYTLIRRYLGGMGIANQKIDKELAPILKKTQNIDDLEKFMIAERMNEKAAQGIGQRADKALGELRAKVGEQEFANFQGMAQELYAYQRKGLQQLKDVGVLSAEQFNNIVAKNQKYIPFNRLMDDIVESGFMGKQANLNLHKTGIYKMKGSKREIIAPLESVIKNTYELTQTVEKQRVLRSLVNVGGFKRIKAQMAPVAKVGEETIFRPSKFEPKAPHITLFEDGKKVFYETSKEIADAIGGMNEQQLDIATKIMSFPAKTLRAGATSLNVGFAIPNIVRDQLSAMVNSKYKGVPIYDFINGLASVIKKDDFYQKWLASGADQATFFGQERTTIQRTLKDITGGKAYKAGKLIKNPLELMRIFGEFSEKGSRVGVFKRALKGAGKEGLTGMDKQLAAMVQSREATVDFARRGAKMKAINAVIPFLNARLQGSLKFIQSARKRPLQTLIVGGGIVSAPAAIMYAYNRQFPEFDEIPDYVKRDNFVIMTGKKKIPYVKIPKGEVGQIFANPVENFLATMYQDDREGFVQVAANILETLSPVTGVGDVIPQAVKPPIESLANYDLFRGQNIVSPYKKNLPPELQFDDRTSETAKKVGATFGVSPAKFEHLVKGYGAGVAGQALQLGDIALGKKPKGKTPVLSRFVGKPESLTKSIGKYWQAKEDKDTVYEKLKADMKVDLKKLPAVDSAEAIHRYISNIKDPQEQAKALGKIKKQITPEIKQKLIVIAKMDEQGLGMTDRSYFKMPPKMRAEKIHKRILSLKPENRAAKIKQLKEAGIIDEETKKLLISLAK